MTDELDFDAPDHCTVGVIGEVGHRLFLLYCRQGLTETTVKVEKQQIAVLAGYLGRIVKELGRPGHLPEDLDFYGTEEFEWVVGTIGVSYDEELDRIIVVLEEVGVDDDEDEERGRRWTAAGTCCAWPCRASRPPPSPSTPPGWSRRDARPARCARSRWTLRATTVRAPTGTGHPPAERSVRSDGRTRPHRRCHGGARPHSGELERHAARHVRARRRGAARRVQARARVSDPCGTSRAGSSVARLPRTSSRSPSGGAWCPRRSGVPMGPSGRGRSSASSTKTGPRTTSRCATTHAGTPC